MRSVLSQKYHDLEYIIVDGGSTDGTLHIIEKYGKHISLCISEPDGGIYDAMNKGLRYATGEIVAFLNSDDCYLPEADVFRTVEQYFQNSTADIVSGGIYVSRDGSSTKASRRKLTEENILLDIVCPHPALFVKRELYSKTGSYDTSYAIAADTKWIINAYMRGVNILCVKDFFTCFREGGISSVKKSEALMEQYRAAISSVHEKHLTGLEEKVNRHYLAGIKEMERMRCLEAAGKEKDKIRSLFDCHRKHFIWGTGIRGRECLKLMKALEIPIGGFIDTNKKQDEIDEYRVMKPEEADKTGLFCITPERYEKEIKAQIRQMSIEEDSVYTYADMIKKIVRKVSSEENSTVHKIIYFMDNYANLGGAANTLLRQAALMKKLGKDVRVVVSKYGEEGICQDYIHICAKEEIPVYELFFSVENQPEGIDILSVFRGYEGVRDFIRKQSPDIVHSVQLNPVAELACRELKIPHVMNIYQALPDFFAWNYPDIFPHYHICDSLYYASFWQRYLGTRSYCVRTMAESFRKENSMPDPEQIRFLCVGQVCERKNQLEVIRAFETVIRQGLKGRLQIWGHVVPPYGEACRKYIADHDLQEHIFIKGYTDDMDKVYQNSDVLICGSKSESYPNAVSEALANGLIVISAPVAGVPEVIRDRENGYLCKGHSAEEIAEGICSFYEDMQAGKLFEISEHAEHTYQSLHSKDAVTMQLMNAYKSILSEYRQNSIAQYNIKDLETEWKDFILQWEKKRDIFDVENGIGRYLWKIFYVVKKIRTVMAEHPGGCYIWGTGKYGRLYKDILDAFAPEIRLSGFIDSYKTGYYMGYEILAPGDISNVGNMILVGMRQYEEVVRQLEDREYRYGTDYFIFEPVPW